jgi:hypothetical protein
MTARGRSILRVSVVFEMDRFAQHNLAQAYERLVPIQSRTTSFSPQDHAKQRPVPKHRVEEAQ